MNVNLNTEKCYLLGLLIGGGIFKSGKLQIVMPYKNWGNLKINPQRGGDIAEDILKRAKPLWEIHYAANISYKIDSDWKIVFDEISPVLKKDIETLGLGSGGEFRDSADLVEFSKLLTNSEMVRSFIAGLIDTIGSLAVSHRRFTDNFQIVSLEFKGKNFTLVAQVVRLLMSLGCTPDQILWNHPNQHSGSDRYYKSWKKGFKIRVALDDYMLKGSFVFQAKQLSAEDNKNIQNKLNTVNGKELKIEGRTSLHSDENSDWLPAEIRGLHFIHYTHLAKFFGIDFPNSCISKTTNFEKHICPFSVLTKGGLEEIKAIISKEDYLKRSKFRYLSCNAKKILAVYLKGKNTLLFGNGPSDGFPVNQIMQGLAYVIGSEIGKNIKGKRVTGSYVDLIKENADKAKNLSIKIGIPDKGTCLHLKSAKFAAIIGYVNDEFNKTLIAQKGIQIRIKNPKLEDCVLLNKQS